MPKDPSRIDLAAAIDAARPDIIDLRFTDLLGRWLRTTLWARAFDARAAVAEGVPIASSNVIGWGRMERSELRLRPDPLAEPVLDPFAQRRSLMVHCHACDPREAIPSPLDARATLARALQALAAASDIDVVRVGVELEFFVFDDVRFRMSPTECFFSVREQDALENSFRESEDGNSGHRVGYPVFHLAPPPLDRDDDWRAELLAELERVGIAPLKHQHEAGPSQHEVSLQHLPMAQAGDAVQLAKYVVQNAARRAGRTATFMPKPLAYAPGSGMHLNLSLWRGDVPLFAGDAPETLRQFLGGVFAHARALTALTNPGTNSFKRLAQLHDETKPLAYGYDDRRLAVRLPIAAKAEAARVELRFPDACANPYLALAAIVMAGLDGLRRGLDAGPPIGEASRRGEGFDVRRRAASSFARDLTEAVIALDTDRDFLRADSVFTDALIEAQILELNRQIRVNRALPHPNEYYMYFSA
jgi:glutamine synthetase